MLKWRKFCYFNSLDNRSAGVSRGLSVDEGDSWLSVDISRLNFDSRTVAQGCRDRFVDDYLSSIVYNVGCLLWGCLDEVGSQVWRRTVVRSWNNSRCDAIGLNWKNNLMLGDV